MKWGRHGGRTPGGGGAFARILDVAPTLIARTGARIPESMQGIDIVTGLDSRSESQRMAFSEEDHEGNVLRALRTEHWKLIEANPGNPRGLSERQLFLIAKDPKELEDVSDTSPWVVDDLHAHADAQQRLARSRSVAGGKAARLSASEEEALRKLGYIE